MDISHHVRLPELMKPKENPKEAKNTKDNFILYISIQPVTIQISHTYHTKNLTSHKPQYTVSHQKVTPVG